MPLIPPGATPINEYVSVWRDEKTWTYFVGHQPVYRHESGDLRLFRLTIAQLIDSGSCRPCQITRVFGISKSHVDRIMRLYRAQGAAAFFEETRRARMRAGGGPVLTAAVLERAQSLLDEGLGKRAVADELGIAYATFRRAVWDGRLRLPDPAEAVPAATDKSARSVEDTAAAEHLGTGCTRTGERVMAALGELNGAATLFQSCRGVPFGGVLCALGALLHNGLLSGLEKHLGRIQGYYTSTQVLLLLGFMALCRVKNIEQLRSHAPGEWGKLIGLDRVPEVRCLRAKVDDLAAAPDKGAQQWAAALSRQWMEDDPDRVGTLYVDGHVRVYHGHAHKLPRRYVSRQRLCLRGCTDYWVNDATGRPFFFVNKPVDPGLIQVLGKDIVPRLLKDVPNQPTAQALEADPRLCRFVLIFDREGYSPGFFKQMWTDHRIACVTYHKHPGEPWDEGEFKESAVSLSNGETVTMRLAERGTLLGKGKDALWVKEVRKLGKTGQQTSLVGTTYGLDAAPMGGRLFSRWCQENFFRYMMQHFAIDLLNEYGSEPLHATEKVVNPRWRSLNREGNALRSALQRRRAIFAEHTLHPVGKDTPEKHRQWESRKADMLEEIQQMEKRLEDIKTQRKETPQHIQWSELEENDRFTQPPPARKRLLDTIRMIAYRAETGLCALLCEEGMGSAAARRIIQDLFTTEADIVPDEAGKRLRIRLHGASRPAVDRSLQTLFEKLNELETTFPPTEWLLHYELLAPPPPQNGSDGVNSTSPR